VIAIVRTNETEVAMSLIAVRHATSEEALIKITSPKTETETETETEIITDEMINVGTIDAATINEEMIDATTVIVETAETNAVGLGITVMAGVDKGPRIVEIDTTGQVATSNPTEPAILSAKARTDKGRVRTKKTKAKAAPIKLGRTSKNPRMFI
jgi:hypothetical protein